MAVAKAASATQSIGSGRGYVEDSGKVDEKIGELTAAVERFLRV